MVGSYSVWIICYSSWILHAFWGWQYWVSQDCEAVECENHIGEIRLESFWAFGFTYTYSLRVVMTFFNVFHLQCLDKQEQKASGQSSCTWCLGQTRRICTFTVTFLRYANINCIHSYLLSTFFIFHNYDPCSYIFINYEFCRLWRLGFCIC